MKVTGKVNSTDRDGNITSEAKINAEEIVIVSDEELESYESTGAQLKTPTHGVKQKKYSKSSASSVSPNGGGGGGGGYHRSSGSSASTTHFKTTASAEDVQPVKPRKLFLRVLDPANTSLLIKTKEVCSCHPGLSDVILVIGPEKKAMRMPFKCDPNTVLVHDLKECFGDEGVIVK